jgi:hypothetical protein
MTQIHKTPDRGFFLPCCRRPIPSTFRSHEKSLHARNISCYTRYCRFCSLYNLARDAETPSQHARSATALGMSTNRDKRNQEHARLKALGRTGPTPFHPWYAIQGRPANDAKLTSRLGGFVKGCHVPHLNTIQWESTYRFGTPPKQRV